MATVVLTWDDGVMGVLERLNLESGGVVQQALDMAIVRSSEPYTPFDSGMLAHTVVGIGTGEITYIQEYAQYLYYGMLMLAENGSSWAKLGETKQLTDIPLNYNTEKHALAGPYWFERAKADHKDEWLKEAKAAVGK